MDGIEWLFALAIGILSVILFVSEIVDWSNAALCHELEFTYVDGKCIDARVIYIEAGRAVNKKAFSYE